MLRASISFLKISSDAKNNLSPALADSSLVFVNSNEPPAPSDTTTFSPTFAPAGLPVEIASATSLSTAACLIKGLLTAFADLLIAA